MYSTCIFCKNSLGENEAIERFPIGRRLAFDAAKGRLWVVCRKCERWNLTPLETRWEAIEECERSFRGTKLRTSTDQIGLARISEGLELVRIGKPLRPEFAAWRYGDQFGARRRRNMVRTGALFVAAAGIPFIGPASGLFGLGAFGFNIVQIAVGFYERMRIAVRLSGRDGNTIVVRRHEVAQIAILPSTDHAAWGLRITHRDDAVSHVPWWREPYETEVRGDAAISAAAQLLPWLNRSGASASQLQDAIAMATRNRTPMESFETAARVAAKQRSWNEFGKGAMLHLINPELRLALEMVSHEDSERRALEGELHLLEEAWRDAEEIAGIADNLFLPSEISTRLSDLKRNRT